ncbi:MAG: DUF2178 domain-containing protein [Methanosarcina sp.]|nr:hypothetical protein BGV40_14720 [Methanosarcina sp. Ant1]
MKQNLFRKLLLLIVISPIVALSFSVWMGKPILALGILFSGAAAIYLSKNKIENLKDDSRIHQISQQASWITFLITVLGFAFGGAAFIAIGNLHPENINQTYIDLGLWMAYVSQGVLVIYTLLYIYYNREYDTKEYMRQR